VPEKLSATEDVGSTPTTFIGVGKAPEEKEPARGFLQPSRRALSEEELSTPAARRFLIAEIERLDQECQESKEFQKYHDQRVTIAALEVVVRASRWNEILSSICLAIGSAGLGAAPSYVTIPSLAAFGWIIFGLSTVLVAGGVASRIWK
jgi:hypothetical protein